MGNASDLGSNLTARAAEFGNQNTELAEIKFFTTGLAEIIT
jgi:hypothetical protein